MYPPEAVPEPADPAPAGAGQELLTGLERLQIGLVRASLRPGHADRVIRLLQRSVGQWWIRAVTARLRHVHGLDRLPAWDPSGSLLVVANHRSFFDLYVTTAELVARGLPQRILFPVRSTFFYDHPAGALMNAAMSFFAMYPPIFRDRKRAALNAASLEELAGLLRRGGYFVGMHPEGTRSKGSDPYSFLPARSGVGLVVHRSRIPVVPVFVNGLSNDFIAQVAGGLSGRGEPIYLVFGKPIDFGQLLSVPPSPKAYKAIAEACLEAIRGLALEEKRLRAERAHGH
jgi:1-acyl-sn-glycerol-3-phosphate acyltransferase